MDRSEDSIDTGASFVACVGHRDFIVMYARSSNAGEGQERGMWVL